ncbi:adenosylcobinamide-GDP ribazoletransferase [Vibrio sp. WXL210]
MKQWLIREWQVYCLALMIFTRIPVPQSTPYSEALKNEAYKYAGLVGLLIGGLNAGVYFLAFQVWPIEIAVVLSMMAGIYLTGAFHEDGFADTCDGFGGGFTPQRKLEIMKDSRVGAYALLGMAMMLLLKYSSLTALGEIGMSEVIVSIVLAHVISRTVAVSFIYTHNYVQQIDVSKLQVSRSQNAKGDLATLLLVALACLILLPSFSYLLGLISVLLVTRWFLGRWMVGQVGGYTGDALGAVQQITEAICYLFLLSWA